MLVRRARTPHDNGWYTICRGERLTRLEGLKVLLGGARYARFDCIQTTNPEELPVRRGVR